MSSSAPLTDSRSTSHWQPLPFFHTGFVIHPYQPLTTPPNSPLPPETSKAAAYRNRFSWSGLQNSDVGNVGGGKGGKVNVYELPLDIGDEVFAFEAYRGGERDGKVDVWYRGYVVQSVSLSSLNPVPSSLASTLKPAQYPKPEPSVLIGIFPASCVHIRAESTGEDPTLTEAFEKAIQLAGQKEKDKDRDKGKGAWIGVNEMDAVREEDEEAGSPERLIRVDTNGDNRQVDMIEIRPIESGQMADRKLGTLMSGMTRTNRPKSLILDAKVIAQVPDQEEAEKEQPPLPSLTAGDSTIAGQQWPLVDEISCAIREWYGRLPTYLANREYRLFNTVTQHIDALFLGRRQMLSQTLSGDELTRVRRECVSRLVKCNVAQGLEIIVRSLEDGSVMVVDRDRAFSGASWISGITCYIYQLQLAYIDLIPLDSLFGKASSLIAPTQLLGMVPAAPRHNRLSILSSAKGHSRSPSLAHEIPAGSFYHAYLDVRAFVASPCAPGETAELYFSLYNKSESRFITEEFCLILNHLGSPARDPEQRLGRLRTLFTDLKHEDVSTTGSVYLVCRIVRNGAMKIRPEATAGTLESHQRNGSVRRGSGNLLDDMGNVRSNISISETATDDSFSVTSGFGGRRTTTVETSMTTTAGSVMDGRPSFRRPLGCAVLELPALIKLLSGGEGGGGLEYNMPIYVPSEESGFASLHEDIIERRTRAYLKSSKAEAIAISLRLFNGVANQLIREHPSTLVDIPLASRLGFPDVCYPGSFRNDVYIRLGAGSFMASPPSSGGSIRRKPTSVINIGDVQVTVEVKRNDGSTVLDAIYAGGTGEPPLSHYNSLVYHHNDRPTFGDLIKVSIPSRVTDCHLLLTFRSRSKDKPVYSDNNDLERPFAFAFVPLLGPTAVRDGEHHLALYRTEKNTTLSPNIYLDAPVLGFQSTVALRPDIAKVMTQLRDRLSVRTILCSNMHTQDDTLRSLFRWQGLVGTPTDLANMLQMFGFVSEGELAKFVPPVFDSLFGILASSIGERQDEIDELVFKSLTRVLSMVTDRRYPNFKPVLDIYIDQHFNHPSASSRLLRSMRNVMSQPNTKEYRGFLKVWYLFFRFIIRSRELDRARGIGLDATSAHIEADFQRQTRVILFEINNLMRSDDKGLIGTQTLAVQHYADILPNLSQVFKPLEIAEMIITFVDAMAFAKGNIAMFKLLLLLAVIRTVFDTAEAGALLVPAMVRWVKPHLGRFEDMDAGGDETDRDARKIKWLESNRLAVTVIAMMVNKSQEWVSSPLILEDQQLRAQEEDNIEYCLSLLPSLLGSYAELSSPITSRILSRDRTSFTYKPTPDVFPMTYPSSLVSDLPPPSLLDKSNQSGDDALASPGTYVCGLAECATVVITLILATPRHNILNWLRETLDIEGIQVASRILGSIIDFCTSLIRFEAFPKQWLTLSLMCFRGVLRLLDPIAELLDREAFIPAVKDADSFDVELWMKCFGLLCELCGSDELALEEHTQQRRRAEWIIAGDLRDEGAGLLLRLWNAIGWPVTDGAKSGHSGELKYGGYQTRFTSLAGRVLGLCLSSHDQMCETAVKILFSMVYAEYVLVGNFDNIETEIFAKLEVLFTRTTPSSDPTMRAYFVAQLRSVFESSPEIDTSFHKRVATFLDSLELFIDLLLSLRDVPETSEWKDERSTATYRLMQFTKQIGRQDLYTRFIHQLVDIAVEGGDWISAGLALKLHADIHEWDLGGDLVDDFVSGRIVLPAQSAFARKEALLYHAIGYLAEAEAYEHALKISQELTIQHQLLTFNVPKLSELLTHQASLWEKISDSTRPKSEFFRVAYFGNMTNLNQGKDYIVRGQPWQRYSDFCEAMQHKFPHSNIYRSKIPPSEFIRNGADQIIWITSVEPRPDLSRPVFNALIDVEENVQSWWRYNGVKQFTSDRPYLKDPGGVEAVMSWIERTVMNTGDELPGVLNRSEIVNIEYEQISPVHNAVLEVQKAIRMLRSLTLRKRDQEVDVKYLGTAINGAVDSPVSGGIKLYRSAFLEGIYVQQQPEESAQIERLRDEIVEYVKTIQAALVVHRRVCRDLAFHEALNSHFVKAFPDELAQLPRGPDSSDSHSNASPPTMSIPRINGHNGDELDLDERPLPLLPAEKGIHPARLSTMSTNSGAAYILPPLRLGPGPAPLTTPPIVDLSSLNLRRPPSVPTSPRASTITSRSSGKGTSIGNRSNLTSPAGTPGIGIPSLGSRALSLVGSARSGSRDSRIETESIISEGTVEGEIVELQPGEGLGVGMGKEKLKVKGLKRFSTLMKRTNS